MLTRQERRIDRWNTHSAPWQARKMAKNMQEPLHFAVNMPAKKADLFVTGSDRSHSHRYYHRVEKIHQFRNTET